MQARRRAQPSGTNSPSSSHPRLKHRARCAIFIRARHAAARVAPVKGYLAGSNTEEPRGSAPRERDHRGGDHPVPSRTRQLSPPSPRVLQRKAAGGQGVALAEGAFLFARDARRCAPEAPHAEGPQGRFPLRAFTRFGVDGSTARRSFCVGWVCLGCEPSRDIPCRLLAFQPPVLFDRVCSALSAFIRFAESHCLANSLEFSFSRAVGHRFGGFDEAY